MKKFISILKLILAIGIKVLLAAVPFTKSVISDIKVIVAKWKLEKAQDKLDTK